MNALRTILVPTDFTPEARNALALGAVLSECLKANLHLLYVRKMFGSSAGEALELESTSDRKISVEERLQEQFRTFQKEPLSLTCVRRDGVDVAAEILQYATEADADLIIMGRHGRRGLYRLWSGGVGDSILGRSECSVLIVPPRDRSEPGQTPTLSRILVPVDFSRESEQAVPVARELAARCGASLNLLYVSEKRLVPIFSDTGLFTVSSLEPDPEITSHAEEALAQLYRRNEGPDVPVSIHVRQGNSAHEILTFTEAENMDLVVMASHGISGYRVFGMGSTAERVVDRSTCPVLILKSFGPPSTE